MCNEVDIVRYRTNSYYQIDIDITDEIGEPYRYLEALNALRNAGPMDELTIHINSTGGYMHTTIQLIDAIKNSQAVVEARLTGIAASGASMIFLSCDSFYVSPMSEMMIHTASFGSYGKGHEVSDHVKHSSSQIKNLLYEIYTGFLTKKKK